MTEEYTADTTNKMKVLLDQDLTLVSQFQDYLVSGTYTDMQVSTLQKNLKYSIRLVT